MGTKAPQFDGNQKLPPKIQTQISTIIARTIKKINPKLKKITLILKSNGIQGGISFGMMPMPMGIPSPFGAEFGFPGGFEMPHPPISAPAKPLDNDLVAGIKQILDTSFGDAAQNILGMIYDPHYSVALDISKILDAARRRDRESLARELDTISAKIKKL